MFIFVIKSLSTEDHCFFCLKKRLYAVKLVHLLHSSLCNVWRSCIGKSFDLKDIFYWHYTWNHFEIKLNDCLEWELLSLCCGVWPLIVIYRDGNKIVGGPGGGTGDVLIIFHCNGDVLSIAGLILETGELSSHGSCLTSVYSVWFTGQF